MVTNIYNVRSNLLSWYKENQRVLPWRGTSDPYRIWLSEIIMQQTRVAQGTPYYNRFIEKFPSVDMLASAEEQEILKLWQGLGYYSRARNLHHAAKQVVADHGGKFPTEYEDILKLKGIGEYTASAIASIAFNKPHPVVDGNVYRVLSRLYAIDTPVNAPGAAAIFREKAEVLLDRNNPGKFNEAMMELGALVCTPKNPGCTSCPLNKECLAYETGKQEELPLKIDLKAVKTRHFHYLFIKNGINFYLNNRGKGDIWQGLYDLPLIEKKTDQKLEQGEVEAFLDTPVNSLEKVKTMVHKLTHQRLEISFYEMDVQNKPAGLNGSVVMTDKIKFKEYPLPKPIEIFLNDYLCNRKIR
jgi:A/G-specific adenine glycosylase